MLKKCKGCGEIKGVSEFYPVAKGRPAPYCKVCDKARASRWAKENREYRRVYDRTYWAVPVNRARHIANRKKRTSASPRYALGAALAHAVKRKPVEVPATVDDLMALWVAQGGRCAVSGIPMTWGRGKITPTSVSIDRLDWSKGYSADNIRLVCYAVNAFKGQMTDEQMVVMARAIVEKADLKTYVPEEMEYLWAGIESCNDLRS